MCGHSLWGFLYPQHTTPRKNALPHKREAPLFFHKFSRRPGVQWASNFFSSKMASCFREVASTSSFFKICHAPLHLRLGGPGNLGQLPLGEGNNRLLGLHLGQVQVEDVADRGSGRARRVWFTHKPRGIKKVR